VDVLYYLKTGDIVTTLLAVFLFGSSVEFNPLVRILFYNKPFFVGAFLFTILGYCSIDYFLFALKRAKNKKFKKIIKYFMIFMMCVTIINNILVIFFSL